MDSHNAGCPSPSYHETEGLRKIGFFSRTRIHKNLQEFNKICRRGFRNFGVDIRRWGRPVFCYPRFRGEAEGMCGGNHTPVPAGPARFSATPGTSTVRGVEISHQPRAGPAGADTRNRGAGGALDWHRCGTESPQSLAAQWFLFNCLLTVGVGGNTACLRISRKSSVLLAFPRFSSRFFVPSPCLPSTSSLPKYGTTQESLSLYATLVVPT